MNALPWFKCYPRDFREGMTGLTVEERGAYATLLMLVYERGGPIPDEESWIASQLWVSVRAWKKIRAALIVKGRLFAVNLDGVDSLMDERAADEIAKIAGLCATRSEAGKTGGKRSAAKRASVSNENSDLGQASASELVNQASSNNQPDIQTIRIGSVVPPNGETTGGEPPKVDPDGKAWEEAVGVLTAQGGMKPEAARSFFGKLLSQNRLEPRDMLGGLAEAFANRTQDPRAFLTKWAQARSRGGGRAQAPQKRVGFV